MEARLQKRVQRYGWDRAATYYDDSWSRQLEPSRNALLEMAALQAGERVLDTACGTGLVTFAAADEVGASGHVVGTDISDEMVILSAERARMGRYTNVSFLRGELESIDIDIEKLAFTGTRFDAVLCSLGLMYTPDPWRAVVEMRRVLRPGGRVVASVWGARSACGWADIFPIVDSRVNTDVCPLFFQLGTGDALADLLERASFEDVEMRRFRVELRYRDEASALRAAFAGGPVALAYSRFDETTAGVAHAEYLASIARYRNSDGYRIPGEFVVASGIKPEAA